MSLRPAVSHCGQDPAVQSAQSETVQHCVRYQVGPWHWPALASTASPDDDNCSYKQRCVTLTETECDRVPECSLVSEEQCTTNTRQQCREEPRQNCRTELQTVCGNNFSFGNNLYGDNLYDGKFYGKRQAPTSTLKNSTFTTKTLLPSPGQPKVSRAFQGWDNF